MRVDVITVRVRPRCRSVRSMQRDTPYGRFVPLVKHDLEYDLSAPSAQCARGAIDPPFPGVAPLRRRKASEDWSRRENQRARPYDTARADVAVRAAAVSHGVAGANRTHG